MTDLEITKLCAEAMGWEVLENVLPASGGVNLTSCFPDGSRCYNPIYNDAQAMALVKKFGLHIWKNPNEPWCVVFGNIAGYEENLNQAICKCVARIQEHAQLASHSPAAPV